MREQLKGTHHQTSTSAGRHDQVVNPAATSGTEDENGRASARWTIQIACQKVELKRGRHGQRAGMVDRHEEI